MKPDAHVAWERAIDGLVASGRSLNEERSLREHLADCAACQQRLENSQRVVAGLRGFAFPATPELTDKVNAALAARARELAARRTTGHRWLVICAVAIALFVAGSLLELQLGGLAARMLDVAGGAVRQDLVRFWIAPSGLLLLLFPALPLLAGDVTTYREGGR